MGGSVKTAGDDGIGRLLSIDPATGLVTVIDELDDGVENHPTIAELEFAGSTLYGWSENDDTLVEIDTATGEVTILSEGTDTAGDGMAYDPDTDTMYAVFWDIGEISAVDLDSGEVSSVTDTDFEPASEGARLNSAIFLEGRIVGVSTIRWGDDDIIQDNVLLAIDPATGETEELGGVPENIDAMAYIP